MDSSLLLIPTCLISDLWADVQARGELQANRRAIYREVEQISIFGTINHFVYALNEARQLGPMLRQLLYVLRVYNCTSTCVCFYMYVSPRSRMQAGLMHKAFTWPIHYPSLNAIRIILYWFALVSNTSVAFILLRYSHLSPISINLMGCFKVTLVTLHLLNYT